MMKIAMSRPASALLSALLSRTPEDRDRILLSEVRSVDWQSLTFNGERHEAQIRIVGPGARDVAARMVDGLADAEFTVPGHIVADVACMTPPQEESDGSVALSIEALTIAD